MPGTANVLRLFRRIKFNLNYFKQSVLALMSVEPQKESLLLPPASVANITHLDRNLFRKTVKVPYILVEDKRIQDVAKYLKPQYLMVRGIEAIQGSPEKDNPMEGQQQETTELSEGKSKPQKKMILLNPDLVKSPNDIDSRVVKLLAGDSNQLELLDKEIELGFNNYNVHDIMDSIFPDEEKRVKSWSIIGHIIHVNLRDEKLPHKELIGQILLETNPSVSLVINKAEIIDTKFRNFSHEVLAKTPEADQLGTTVTVHSNNCTFKFDFAKVYWNPRLNTEHSRFLARLDKGRDIVYDMFAGIGPFAIPAAKKKCRVLANDLNPEAYHWLRLNIKTNKVDQYCQAYNLDAREFVRARIKQDLMASWTSPEVTEFVIKPTYHVLMNLPGMAIEFLDSFVGLMEEKENDSDFRSLIIPPLVHCYTFLRRDRPPNETICSMVEETIQAKMPDEFELKMVRTVAPFKDMYRISFKLPIEVLFDKRKLKKQKIS